MDSREHFELNNSTGVGFDYRNWKHVTRITNRSTKNLTRLILEDQRDEDLGKFLKPTNISQLSFTDLNPQRKKIEIVTFNIPENKIAYKAIYNSDEVLPQKIFSSIEEGKWTVISNPSETILEKCAIEKENLKRSLHPSTTETNMVFYR